MARKPRIFANLKVGKPQGHPTLPSHVRGVREANRRGGIERDPGLRPDPFNPVDAKGTAARSTGINARKREPIDPRMPNLSPS